jgi:DNA-binding GntR family transcriptional regulator
MRPAGALVMNTALRIFAPDRFAADGSAPLYSRLKRLVQNAIEAGELKQGDSIPSERDVADLLHVSRVTVRKAFSELVADGVLVQRRGSGTYVNGPVRRIEQPLSRLTSFSEDMKLRGLNTDADWLNRSSGLPTPEEAMKLSISPSDGISRFHRLRRADGLPLALELAVIPQKFLPDPATVTDSAFIPSGPFSGSMQPHFRRRKRPCSTCRQKARPCSSNVFPISPMAGQWSSRVRTIAATAMILSPN